jgi:ribosomal protein S18 acetylase RimI-like enzyme
MKASSPGSSKPRSDGRAVELRPLRRADRAAIERIVRATGAFREDEVAVALELVDADPSEGYRFVVAESEGEIDGYACFGATPLTIGVWDLYWIAVDPGRQGRGIGRRLFDAAVEAVRAEVGRMLLIETGGKASYGATRKAYVAWGCVEVARVPDFYEVGDDKVVFARRV